MQAHKESYLKVAAAAGVSITTDIIDEFAGLPIPKVVEEINRRFGSSFDPIQFEGLKSELFYNEYIPTTKPIKFVVEHLKLNVGKVKIGVVSGGSRRMIEKTLDVLGIIDVVDVLVCAGDTTHGKPYAEPFLLAANKLNVAPTHCLVFEDGNAGVKAATAAGMASIRIDRIV